MQCQRRPENAHKKYVKVRADFMPDGRIRPLMFRVEDEQACHITNDPIGRPAASLKAGGRGTRYICQVEGGEVHLFHDGDFWFIEVD